MSDVKSKISLSFIMLLIVIMSLGSVALAVEKIYIPVNLTVKNSSDIVLKNGADLGTVKAGDKITATAYCTDDLALLWSQNTNFMSDKGYKFNDQGMALLGYMFDSTDKSNYITSSDPTKVTITIPNYAPDSEHFLVINAVAACDGLPVGEKEYQATSGTFAVKFKMASATTEPDEPVTTVKVYVTKNSAATVQLKATITNSTFSKFLYNWDGEEDKTLTVNPSNVALPTEVGTHKLTVKAVATDGSTAKTTYTYVVEEPEDDEENDELIIEPWMKENDDLKYLAVSLRSEPYEENRANKNIYALKEKVIYYVDYKNGGKDTDKEVTLTLTLPLSFSVVDSDGAKVSKSNKTLTWTFDGMEKDEAGTKVVVIKYTTLGKTSLTHKQIIPKATISLGKTEKDISAVPNLIVKDFDTEINDEHEPYMYGDRDTGKFRADDTITRGEGALVLTRIFGISTKYDENTYAFPDLNQTYLEARKAVIAATACGIIQGYPDGTYRPNKAMTRGEFITILARQIEEEYGEGFEVKDEESLIKVYKDKNRFYFVSDTEYYDAHWSVAYATLLARLNMTPLEEDNTNLRVDDPITRAEVAQLVNFYLMRAPAEVTSSTRTQFPDLSRRHKLFADIVEATRDSHTYSITEDGTEEDE